MPKKTKIVSIIVIAFFIGVVLTPAVCAEDDDDMPGYDDYGTDAPRYSSSYETSGGGVRSDLERKCKRLEEDKDYLLKHNARLRVDISDREKKMAAMSEELSLLQKQLEKAGRTKDPQIRKLTERVEKLEEELAAEKDARSATARTLKDAEAEIRDMTRTMRDTRETQEDAVNAARTAQEELKRLRELTNNERIDMHYNLGVAYDMHGMFDDAEREYLKCLKIDPDDPDIHYNLGILYDDKLNMNHKAKRHYEEFLKYRPKGEDADRVKEWLFKLEEETRLGLEVR